MTNSSWTGRNFPADTKFGKISDNLRLTSTTHITPQEKERQGPKSSLTFYAYNIPNANIDGNMDPGAFPSNSTEWFDGGIPNAPNQLNKEGAPYIGPGGPGGPKFSHTLGGAAIVLEPSGNVLSGAPLPSGGAAGSIDANAQINGLPVPYELNFYMKSG